MLIIPSIFPYIQSTNTPNTSQIILRVRKAVRAIQDLDSETQSQSTLFHLPPSHYTAPKINETCSH
jgi:hypothetical protein